jgi:hypothetical protein
MGTHQVMPEETSKGLGAPKTLKNTTSLFHWGYVSTSLTLPSFDIEDMIDTEPMYGGDLFLVTKKILVKTQGLHPGKLRMYQKEALGS